MKIEDPNAASLTNFEVVELLKRRGGAKDPTRVIAPVAPSEYKVYDFLVGTPAQDQTEDKIREFMERVKPFNLVRAEIFNLINIAPRSVPGIGSVVGDEQAEKLLELVNDIFPPPQVLEPEQG